MKVNHHQYINSIKIGFKFILAFLVWFPLLSVAQVEEMDTDEEVMVIAPFNPSISKAQKLNFQPQADTNRAQKLKIDYLTTPQLFETNYSLEKLTAAKFVDRKNPKYAQNFAKAGYGLYNSIYGELFVNSEMSKTSQVGVHVRHYSTNGGIDKFAYSGSSLTTAKVWTKSVRRKQTTSLSVDYKRNQIHQYGFRLEDYPILSFPSSSAEALKNDINQVFSHIGFNGDILGNFDTKFRDWKIQLGYKYFWDIFKTSEHLIDIDAYYEHPVDWINVDQQHIGVAFNTQTYSTKFNFSGLTPSIDSSESYFHGLYDIAPYYQIKHENLTLELGAKLSMGLDSNTNVRIAPRIKLEVGLLGDQLLLYAHVNGGIYNNSVFGLSTENNFISPVIPLMYTENKYQVKVGLKGHYLSFLDYHAFVETSAFENMPMYVTDVTSPYNNTFTVIYDGGQQLGAGMEFLFKTERWNVELMGKYQSFTMDTATRAWQKPSFTYKLKVGYYVLENLKVTGLLLGQSKMYNLYQGEKTVEPWMDFSLMADYHLSKDLGFFLKVTNIFSDQYHIWYEYPVQSIGFMGGIHFAF
ncbi:MULTISPECIES: hypothetical protein [unclassified Lentimicrobium]|uniref:hypothetical protein n=1 Tax=unclassified Lentimicrobium TaxID=2677434 RepID=UPI001557C3DE|nr:MULTISPECIES: hypothetical protein [unclassified Lentimicrobium]NPD44152.1 hypothetical protein [Lentimicrobium sp. S6]NPD83254.1 hypothetical protein [Lentimicrobium sp. L6]